MTADVPAGGILVAGALVSLAAVVSRPSRVRGPALAGVLGCAAAAELTGSEALRIVAAGLGVLALAALVVVREGPLTRLSRLDGVMGAAAAGGVAVALDADAALVIAIAGAMGSFALCRWRPTPASVAAAAGVVALAVGGTAGAPVAAVALVLAVCVPEAPAGPGPEFSPVVLGAIVAFAVASLTLLTLGQFEALGWPAAVLAALVVVAGTARSGFTVVERLRESEHRAITDELTGLANRRHLMERLHAAIEDADNDSLALLLVDLDGFKELNDTLGHHAGDEVLRQIGPRLRRLLRTEDTLARLGGDEFAVVLRPADEMSASTAGLRLRAALERSFDVGDISVHIDASVGIAMYPEHGRDAPGLLQRADVAMYEAKRMRTGHEVYLSSRDRHSRDRLALVGELHDALQAGELVLHYQPKADVVTRNVRGVEALVRWQHPRRGLLGPSEFLPLMEQSGLTRTLTAFVLERAFTEIGDLRRRGFDLAVAANLGPADLLDLGLPSEVERLLDRCGLTAEHVELEVSEDIVMADVERTMDVLVGLRATGVRTALDDFGAGHAALRHVKQLQVDTLKVDRSFVLRVDEDERDAAIVHSLVDLGRRLGVRVVAEGVESAAAMERLAQWRCDEAQGYYVGRPMPAAELAQWLIALSAARDR